LVFLSSTESCFPIMTTITVELAVAAVGVVVVVVMEAST
jgi:hypothetical protein